MSYIPPQILAKAAFGELMVAQKTPIIQAAAQYGLGSKTRVLTNGTGSTGGADSSSLFFCSSGTTTAGFGSTFSKRSLAYKAGMGMLCEMTILFDTPVVDNTQRGGMLNATDNLAFGYIDTTFGILHFFDGRQEIQDLQVTTVASGGENATVTIDGTGYTVPLTAGTVQSNAVEIADSLNGQVPLWVFQAIDDTVVSRSVIADTFAGAFSFSSATAIATFTQIASGQDVTEDFIPQAEWNGASVTDWVDLEGESMPFDPLKGNVYQIQAQYLGFGDIFFSIEAPDSGEFEIVHTIEYTNRNLTPSASNPSFRAGWASLNRGGTTDVVIKGASYGLFIEGKRRITEGARSMYAAKTSLGSTATNLITIQNRSVFGGKVNLAAVIPILITAETDSTKGAILQVTIGATIAGSPMYNYIDEDESIVIFDTAGTTVTGGTNIATVVLGPSGQTSIDLSLYDIELLPSEILTVDISKFGGGTHDASASIVWKEDI